MCTKYPIKQTIDSLSKAKKGKVRLVRQCLTGSCPFHTLMTSNMVAI